MAILEELSASYLSAQCLGVASKTDPEDKLAKENITETTLRRTLNIAVVGVGCVKYK